jgi:hypothetical protein
MIGVLVVMTTVRPLVLWRANVTAQRSSISSTEQKSKSLGIWLQGRFAAWTDEEKGLPAAIEILLPLAAMAFGGTALGSCST